jgi:5-hydroxyisourate hydrolase-like protein (transthyretin family)
MQQRRRWLPPWVPLGLVVGGGILAVCLIGPSTPEVQAEPLSPKGTAVFQTTDKIVVSVPLPERKQAETLTVEVRHPRKSTPAASSRKQIEVPAGKAEHVRVELTGLKIDPADLELTCTLGKEHFTVPLKDVLVVKAHETSLNAGTEFFANSDASLRLGVHAVKSLTETVPLPGATVDVRIDTKGAKGLVSLFEGKTDAEGRADVHFKLPALDPGTYKLSVATKSALGEEKLEHDIKVKSAPKVLLVTDKPLYQPGQVIHIRALALSGFDLTPAAARDLLLEVSDGKGNKVFKKTLKTSDYGIAHADFQLADEVNQGDYRIQATLGDQQSDKTVTVKPYVLPKFKLDVKADKKFYLPKETITVEFQGDYIFGKPIAGAKLKVTASTFDVAFKDFFTFETKADANGHAKFDVKLPDYFVGQPLASGNGIVKLEVKITDTADHTETVTKTYPVVDQAVRINFVPEGGRVIPGVENRIFVAATYPDGSPAAKCDVNVWFGQKAEGKPFATIKTDDTGLAEFAVTPDAKQFRQGEWAETKVEMLGQQNVVQAWLPKNLFDVFAEAKDATGSQAKTHVALASEPMGENVLLRLDKALYKGGDTINVDVRTSGGLPTVYLDVVRAGQTLLTKWVDVKDGKATYKLDLPESVFGSLEVHAYQVLTTGEIVRDARVVYVQPGTDLKIDVKADKDVYLPGKEGVIKFEVTDKAGKPTAAALGVLIVDEAVYALQDMQPGLEKLFFTLQEELLKPQAQAVYKADTVDNLVRQPVLAADKQRVAEVLLTAARPKPPTRWMTDPAIERRLKAEAQIQQIGWMVFNHAFHNKDAVIDIDAKTGKATFKANLLADAAKQWGWNEQMLTDPIGGKLTLEGLSRMEPNFKADRLAAAITRERIQNTGSWFIWYTSQHQAKFLKDGKWTFPDNILAEAVKAAHGREQPQWLVDAWGRPLKLVKRDKKIEHKTGQTQWDYYEIVSAGPDGKFGTDDDVAIAVPHQWQQFGQDWWMADGHRLKNQQLAWNHRRNRMLGNGAQLEMMRGAKGGADFDRFPPGAPIPKLAEGRGGDEARKETKTEIGNDKTQGAGQAGAAPVRVREYFPETLLWRPSIITDDRGRAELPLTFADSITTWRLTASASSKGGALGGTTLPLRVFQDFFVDLDLPLTLTRNDEVSIPATVYNYLKEAQTVTLDLQPEPWFELVDGLGMKRAVEMKANEVKSVSFRIRATKIGHFPLQVTARGTQLADAIKRVIEVVPDGQKKEQVVTDRLKGTVACDITIPENALPDASKLFVKVYPGVMSQVLEGVDGLIRLPGG